jgi:small subunit ribosomal protein S16
MLVIRLQRTGRKGHAMFRIVVQDSRRTPTSGKVVARLGSYDPHTKTVILDKEKAGFYLEHGAQPSNRLVSIFKLQSVKLPDWVIKAADKKKDVKNPEKRRSTAPQEEKPTEPAKEEEIAPEATEVVAEAAAPEAPVAEETDTVVAEEEAAPVEEAKEEEPKDSEPAAPEA